MSDDAISLHPLQHLELSLCFIIAILIGVQGYHIVVSACISLMVNDAEHPFTCLLIYYLYILFSERPVHVSCPFSNWFIILLLLLTLRVPNIFLVPFSEMFENIFFYSVACLFSASSQGLSQSKRFNFKEVLFINFYFYVLFLLCKRTLCLFIPRPWRFYIFKTFFSFTIHM